MLLNIHLACVEVLFICGGKESRPRTFFFTDILTWPGAGGRGGGCGGEGRVGGESHFHLGYTLSFVTESEIHSDTAAFFLPGTQAC